MPSESTLAFLNKHAGSAGSAAHRFVPRTIVIPTYTSRPRTENDNPLALSCEQRSVTPDRPASFFCGVVLPCSAMP